MGLAVALEYVVSEREVSLFRFFKKIIQDYSFRTTFTPIDLLDSESNSDLYQIHCDPNILIKIAENFKKSSEKRFLPISFIEVKDRTKILESEPIDISFDGVVKKFRNTAGSDIALIFKDSDSDTELFVTSGKMVVDFWSGDADDAFSRFLEELKPVIEKMNSWESTLETDRRV